MSTAVRLREDEWTPEELAGAECYLRPGRGLMLRVYSPDGTVTEHPIKPAVEPAGEDVDG